MITPWAKLGSRERALAENPTFIQSKSHCHSEPQFPTCEWGAVPPRRTVLR